MKIEQEFLNGMWLKVDILEHEELEKTRVKALNRRSTIKAIGITFFIILAFLFLTLYSQITECLIYPITIGALSITFIIEYLSTNTLEDEAYGNYSN